jgi:hypothetical protein
MNDATQDIRDFFKAVDSGWLGQMPSGFNQSAFVIALRSRLNHAAAVEAQGGVEDFATESANASLIVRAVNSHDALVEALEKLTVWVNETYVVEDCRHDRDPDCMSCQAIVLVDAACKAIASAKGTTE